jgi:hypothetical protein
MSDKAKVASLYWVRDSVFFIGDISLKGAALLPGIFGPDAAGVTYSMLSFIASSNAPWIPQYGVTVAHEIGHILGLPHNVFAGLMVDGGEFGRKLQDAWFLAQR